MEAEQFRGNVRGDIKRVSRNSIREVRDNSKAVPGVRYFIRGCMNG